MVAGDTDNCKIYFFYPIISYCSSPQQFDLNDYENKNLLLVSHMFIYLYIALFQKVWKAKNGLLGFTVIIEL